METYDVDKIIRAAAAGGQNISPSDRTDWAMFGHALRLLGYGASTFAALSYCDERTSLGVWRREIEKGGHRVRMTQDQAAAKIIALAREAGYDLINFLCSPDSDGREDKTAARQRPPQPPPPPKLPPVYIDLADVDAAARNVGRSTLYRWLCGLFPVAAVNEVCAAYKVGATAEYFGEAPGLASAFPLINAAGQCVDVHLQPYEADGHRWKPPRHKYCQNWLLATRKKSDRRDDRWALFGEHLLPQRPTDPVALVESEKTALIAAMCAPAFVWCATTSLVHLNSRRCDDVKGRRCFVFPDLDGIAEWEKRCDLLRAVGFDITFCGKYISDNATGPKDDLADILTRAAARPYQDNEKDSQEYEKDQQQG